jgi:hypothetical protein
MDVVERFPKHFLLPNQRIDLSVTHTNTDKSKRGSNIIIVPKENVHTYCTRLNPVAKVLRELLVDIHQFCV